MLYRVLVLVFLIIVGGAMPAMSAPANPTSLTATAGVNQITLTWGTVSGATGYKIYRSESGGGYALIATQSTTSFLDQRQDTSAALKGGFNFDTALGLEYGVSYTYKVAAYDGSGESSGNTVISSPVAAQPYNGGSIRGKVVTALIVHSTYMNGITDPTLAQVQSAHDFIRANITTNITLFVSPHILFANSGAQLDVLNYLKGLVTAYGYDIVTMPHPAAFPTTTRWSQGLAAEQQNIIDNHNKCFAVFGKYPVTSWAWHYNKDLVATAVSLGYKLVPSGFREQAPTHGDGWGSLGFPYHLYRPSKLNTLVPGSSESDSFDVISGFTPLQSGPYRANQEPATGKNNATALGCGDAYPSVFAQQKTMMQMLEDSQAVNFDQFHYVPLYFDPFWMDETMWFNGTVAANGVPEQFYMQKNMAIWMKQRYGGMLDYMKASEFADYAYNTIPKNDPHPPYALLSYVEQTGWLSPQDKQIRYDSQNYSAVVRYKAGSGGYLRDIQEIPYSPSTAEPSYPNSNWNIAGGWYRSNATDARVVTLTRSGTTYSLNTGVGINIHAPTITSDATARTLIASWDVYDGTDSTRLITLKALFKPSGLSYSYSYKDASVTAITEANNLTAATLPVMFDASVSTAPQTTGLVTKYQSGDAVKAVVVGNSVGCGYRADHTLPGDDQLTPILQYSGTARYKLQSAYRTTALPFSSWAQQLRSFLIAKNASSTIRNESGNGWATPDHLLGYAGINGTPQANSSEDTIEVILAMTPLPDVVFIPLEINDANYGLGTATLRNNLTIMANRLLAANITPVIVLENDNDLAGFSGYIDAARAVADSFNAVTPNSVGLIDTYTPTHNLFVAGGGWSGSGIMWDHLHPNQTGHNLIFQQYSNFFNAASPTVAAASTATMRASFR